MGKILAFLGEENRRRALVGGCCGDRLDPENTRRALVGGCCGDRLDPGRSNEGIRDGRSKQHAWVKIGNAYTYFRDIWEEDTIWNGYGVVQTRRKSIRLMRITLDKHQRRVFVNAEMKIREIS
jgi:hypothetical protein